MTSWTSRTAPNIHVTRDNGALSKFTWSGDTQWKATDGKWKDSLPVILDTTMADADFSRKGLGTSGAIILAAFIGSKFFQDNGAMSILNVSNNHIGAEGVKALAFFVWEMSKGNGALSKLDIQNSSITEATKAKIQQICVLKSITCLL